MFVFNEQFSSDVSDVIIAKVLPVGNVNLMKVVVNELLISLLTKKHRLMILL